MNESTLDNSIKYLIYSSHKSGTSTIQKSFQNSNIKSLKIHSTFNCQFYNQPSKIKDFFKEYYSFNKKKIKLISIFRDPLERHISSFFQSNTNNTEKKKKKHMKFEDTIFSKKTIDELIDLFKNDLSSGKFVGAGDSLMEMSKLGIIDLNDLSFDSNKLINLYQNDNVELYLFRFDLIIMAFNFYLSKLPGCSAVKVIPTNLTKDKNINELYKIFKRNLKLEKNLIEEIYQRKEKLNKIFYKKSYKNLIRKSIEKYS